MKLLITMTFIILSSSAFAQEGWINQTPSSQLPGLYGVYALDEKNIWVAGEEGTIRHSTDGGVTWDSVASGVKESLYTIEFINPDTGWVAGDDDKYASTVLRTTDAGASWHSQSLSGGGALPIYDLDFIKGASGEILCGYITGGLGFTWKTQNYGENWNSVRNKCENTFWSCCFVDKDNGWFVGTPSVAEPYTIMQTEDGGDTWQQQTNPTDRNLRGVCFGSDQKGIAVGLVGTILYTSDAGKNWQASTFKNYIRWESVFLTNTGKAWAVGSLGSIAYSDDWGQSWVLQESGVSSEVELWEVFFINDNEGWIVGGSFLEGGVILHTTNSGLVSEIGDDHNNIVYKYELEQNYPNPFNPKTKISWQLAVGSHVELTVYNMLGEKVSTLISAEMNSGHHAIGFDGSGLASGIYYYQIIAGHYREVKKMILVK